MPEFFANEKELRNLWSAPDTRSKLLAGLAEAGFGHDQLAEMQKLIDAEKSDLFDVLAYVAYTLPPMTREVRASLAKPSIASLFSQKQPGVPRFRAGAVREGRRGRTRAGKALAAAEAEVQQRHR